MSMKKSLCEQCYYQYNCPVDPNYKAERAPTIITTCTDYEPAPEVNCQCQNCQYYLLGTCAYYEQPLDHYPDEDITCTDYAPKRDYCDTNCIDCSSYYDCESPFKLDEQTMNFWLNERDYEPPYREPFGNDDCDVPYVNYVQEPEPDDDDYEPDYYEQGTQSILIDEFTEALLDWLETPKSK